MTYIVLQNHLETLAMKYLYKPYMFFIVSLATAVIFCFVATNYTYAEDSPNREDIRSEICSKVDSLDNKIEESISHKKQSLENLRSDRSKKMQLNFEDKTKRIANSRSQWDKNREIHYKKLGEKASSSEQKTAIDEFRVAIETAVQNRREAFDKATQDYRNSVEYAMNNKQNGVDEIVNEFQTELSEARQQAQRDCKNNKEGSEIRSNFNNKLLSAREDFTSDRNGVDQILLQINTAKQNREEVLQRATQEFQLILQSAKEKLRSALEM